MPSFVVVSASTTTKLYYRCWIGSWVLLAAAFVGHRNNDDRCASAFAPTVRSRKRQSSLSTARHNNHELLGRGNRMARSQKIHPIDITNPTTTRTNNKESSSLVQRSGSRSDDSIPDTDDGVETSLLRRKKRELTKEFFAIAAPALVQLAAEPLAALVDTAYLGKAAVLG